MTNLTRRKILGVMAGSVGGMAASSLMGTTAFAQEQRIRHFWWGNPARDERTFKVIEMFEAANPGVEVSGETIGWGDYWTKVATQTAGGNMADVIQMAHTYIHEYVGRGAIMPLDEYVGNGLGLDHFDQGANDVGTIDGQLYGVNIGSTTQSLPFNKRVFDEAGVTADPLNWTWDEFASALAQVTEATGGEVTGSEDLSLYIETFEPWARENGRDMWGPQGGLEMTEEDVSGYWQYWADLRQEGYVESPDRTVMLDKTMDQLGLIQGNTAMTFRWANQAAGLQSLTTDEIGLATIPQRPDAPLGHYVLPSMFLCVTRDVKNIDVTLDYINYWISNPDALRVLGLDRGVPPSQAGRDALAPTLSPVENAILDYYGTIQPRIGAVPNASPPGAGEVRDAFMRIGTEVVLGNMSASEAAGLFISDADAILVRAS